MKNTKGKQRARTSSAGTLLRLRCPSAAGMMGDLRFGISHTGLAHPVVISILDRLDDRFAFWAIISIAHLNTEIQ